MLMQKDKLFLCRRINMERLQKFLADAGIASRRKSEELIQQGKVKVNGEIVKELGFKVDPEKDKIEFEGKILNKEEERIVLMLNKPKDVISSVKDPQGRKTVIDMIPGKFPRLYPVGRLDYESEGMMLLTNDGELANKITHPKNEVKKVYSVWVFGYPSKETMSKFSKGVELEDGTTAPAEIKLIKKGKTTSQMEVTIKEGKKRQIRRMFEVLGHPVSRLVRTQIGELKLGTLEEGKFKKLKEAEIKRIFVKKEQSYKPRRKFGK